MSKQRIVKDSFWTDPYVENLDPIEKLMFLYLLTNPLCNVLGIYEIQPKRIAYETGIDKDIANKILERFVKNNKLIRIDSWIVITNFPKNQSSNPSIKQGMQRIYDSLPHKVKQAVAGSSQPMTYLTLLNLTLLNSTQKMKKGKLKEKVNVVKFSIEDMEMTNLLISLIQQNNQEWQMRGNKDDWAKHIEMLHRIDGRTYEQIETMIKWTQQDQFWSQNILSTAKLREKFNDLIPRLKGAYQKSGIKKQIFI